MLLANEHVAAFLAARNRAALYRVHERPDPQAIGLLLAKLATSACRRRLRPTCSRRRPRPSSPARSRAASRRTSSSPAAAGRRSRRSCCARSSAPATTRGTSATPASRARRTATSPRRSAATPTSSSTARSSTSSASATSRRPTTWTSSPSTPRSASARRRSSSTSPTRSASPGCSRTGCASAAGRSRGRGEVIGLIGSGLFVRFGDVFEGFLPARRLPGEFFELNATGTALVGRRSGRAYRLGDPIEVRVESIARGEGKVELALATRRAPGRRG